MLDVINLALPFFGVIFLGFACGRLKQIPDSGLAWMTFFLIYLALPALFYRILARTPLDELNNAAFVIGTTLATASSFALAFGISRLLRRGQGNATIAGLAGAYGNIGYMGPGLALATLGPAATAPVALIFCFDNILLFSLAPMLMAFAGSERQRPGEIAREIARKILLNPLLLATFAGVASAALRFQPPTALDRLMQFMENAAAPCALFTLGVTVALRRLEQVPWEVPVVAAVKLVVHPALALLALSLVGPFDASWVYTAVLMAALPPALNVFIIARQYDVWVRQASSSVLLGTLASIVTLTTVMWLVKTQALPVSLLR
jgi:malonate transporter and related proteins